jgi:hypothetical protein
MRLAIALLLVAFLVAPASAQEKFGAGVSLDTSTTVAALLANPESYLGKTVRVDGIVKAVCTEMGCWMELADSESGEALQFKVDDGVIVFPVSAKGKRASAEGVFEKVVPGADEHEMGANTESARHEAQKAIVYRVKATGAVVY